MKHELLLNEIQDNQYKILEFLSNICHEHEINYYLCYGTLLGAVRHEGFIPWDDDIDVVVPRNDYIKLINVLRNQKEYRLLSNNLYDDYYFPFAKLVDPNTQVIEYGIKPCSKLGVWVDIFPLDKVPKNKLFKLMHFTITQKIVGLNKYLSLPEDLIDSELNTTGKKIKYRISKLFNKKMTFLLIDTSARLFQNIKEYEWSNIVWTNKCVTFKSTWFEEPAQLKFKDSLFDVPADYHKVLESLYGNYMELPPINQRHSIHNYKCWIIE